MPWDVHLPLKTAIFIFSTPPTSLQMHLSSFLRAHPSVLPSFPPWRLNLPVVGEKALNIDSPWAYLTTNSSIPSWWSQWLPPPATKAEAFDPTSHQSPRSERIRARWSGVFSLRNFWLFFGGGSLFTPRRYKCVSFNRSTSLGFSLGSLVIQKFRASDMEAMVLGCYLKAACRCLICIQSRVGFSSK